MDALKGLLADQAKFNEIIDKSWAKFDFNKTGVITDAELTPLKVLFARNIKKAVPDIPEIKDALNEVKVNAEDKITKEEFITKTTEALTKLSG